MRLQLTAGKINDASQGDTKREDKACCKYGGQESPLSFPEASMSEVRKRVALIPWGRESQRQAASGERPRGASRSAPFAKDKEASAAGAVGGKKRLGRAEATEEAQSSLRSPAGPGGGPGR